MGGRAFRGALAGAVLWAAACSAGCSLERVSITGVARDAGSTPDSGGWVIRDAGPGGCTERCEGQRAIHCAGESMVEEDCAGRGARCVEDDDGAASCVARACEPLRTRCEGDVLHTCDAIGAGESETTCEHGCHEGACATSPPVCPWGQGVMEIVDQGTYAVDLCGRNDDFRFEGDECGGTRASGEDTLVRLVVRGRRRLRIDLRDIDGPAAIDTVLSLRRRCDAIETQLGCADHVLCEDAEEDLRGSSCESGRQPRQARLDLMLDAGTYWLVIDSENRGSFRCGRVELRVRGGGMDD